MFRIWVHLAILLSLFQLPWSLQCAYPGVLALLLWWSMFHSVNSISTPKSILVFAEYGERLESFLNPLYQRRYYKKNPHGIFLKSQYKILSRLQLSLFFIMETENLWYWLVNLGFVWQYDVLYRFFVILNILGWCLLFCIIGLQIAYFIRYEKDYTYWENKEGIWQPFRYVFHSLYCEFRSRERLVCYYGRTYEETLEYIAKNQNNGYELSAQYHMKDGNEIFFYTKREKECLRIFQIAHIDHFEKEHFQKLDNAFALYWKKIIGEGQELPSVKFTSVLMMDECYQELNDKILRFYSDVSHNCYVRQKPGRERLFCFVTGSRLWMPWCYNRIFRWKDYYEMVDEMGDMVGIKRKSNGRLKFQYMEESNRDL